MPMLKYSRKILCLMLAALLFISMSGTAFAKSVTMRVFTDKARVYQSASTSSASLALPKGLKVSLTGVSGDWARIQYKGRTGYCALAALEATRLYTGYISKSGAYVYQTPSTSSRRIGVPVNTKLYIIGKWGNFWRVCNASGSAIGFVPTGNVSKSKVATTPPVSHYKKQVTKLNWYGGGSDVLKKGQYGYIYDIGTNQFIRIKRMGGSSHADVEPATKEDTAKLKSLSGGFSWDSRACILIANGQYVACAVNTMPHGEQTIKNNGFDGQFCLHMVGSKTHGTDAVNSAHQAAINAAYNWAHK